VVGAEPTILVVDAHALLASSLSMSLRHCGFQRVATVDPEDLEAGGNGMPVHLVTGDIVLMGLLYGDGRTALPLIAPLARTGCRVIVMTKDQALPLARECLERGAETVLDKDMSFERLVEVLRRLIAGERAMTEEERAALLQSVELHEAAGRVLLQPFETLTEREAEVLANLVVGAAPKQIAHAKDISVSTVRGHIQRVLSKLGVSSQREALAMARHAGWP
jgi:DNA-binding NarL/FixJ family response regulator